MADITDAQQQAIDELSKLTVKTWADYLHYLALSAQAAGMTQGQLFEANIADIMGSRNVSYKQAVDIYLDGEHQIYNLLTGTHDSYFNWLQHNISDIQQVTGQPLNNQQQTFSQLYNNVLNDHNSQLGDSNSLFNNLTDPITQQISQVIDDVTQTLSDISSSIGDSIGNLLLGVEDWIKTLLEPISEAFDFIADEISQIGDFFSGLFDKTEELVISFGDSISQWFQDTVLDPISEFWDRHIKIWNSTWQYFLDTDQNWKPKPHPVNLSENFSESTAEAYSSAMVGVINNPQGIVQQVSSWFLKGMTFLSAFGASIEPVLSSIEHGARHGNPIEPLNIGDILEATFRHTMSPPEAASEAKLHGINDSRFNILLENLQSIPATQVAAYWLARGLISKAEYDLIGQKNKDDVSERDNIYASQFQLPSPRLMSAMWGRITATKAGHAPSSFMSSIPQEIKDLYKKNQLDDSQAELDWLSGAGTLGIDWHTQAYYRGLKTKAQVAAIAEIERLPAEDVDLYIETSRPLLRFSTYLTLYKEGVMTEAQARDGLKKHGYAQSDIDALIKRAEDFISDELDDYHKELQKLSIDSSVQMYQEGIVSKSQVYDVLIAHKLSPEAANLQIRLIDTKIANAERKQFLADVILSVQLSQMTPQEGIDALYSEGFSDLQVAGAQKKWTRAKTSTEKLPSLSMVSAMFKKGIATEEDYLAYLYEANYSPEWIPFILQLEISSPTEPPITGA